MPENPDHLSVWRTRLLRTGDGARRTGLRSAGDPRQRGLPGAIATILANQETILANRETIIANQDRVIAGREKKLAK